MTSQPDLIAAYWTIAGGVRPGGDEVSPVALEERLTAAAAAGYRGVGLHHPDLMRTVERIGYAGVRRALEDAGMVHVELEMLVDWFVDGPRRVAADAVRRDLLEAAAELGPWHVKLGGSDAALPWEYGRMVEELGVLCDEFQAHGCEVVFEPMPYTNFPTLDAAVSFMEDVGHPNAGLLLDVWHVARMGESYDALGRIPLSLVRAVELDDAAAEPVGTLFEDTIDRRLLPGEGDLRVREFVEAVERLGYRGPYGVEILSDLHRLRSLATQAAVSFTTSMAEVVAARE